MMDEKQRLRAVYKVTIAGSIINVLLLVLKFAAGILGHSAAMIADAIHSLTDFATDVIVLVFVKLGNKPMDRDHDYGHGKYETLATAIIVLIHKGDEVLLVHARNFKGNFDSLVAGFVETGESLEEAVHREVMEETGLTITNIKYFGSQPWPYPSGPMIGFTADYVDGEIHLQKEELSRGRWFRKDNLPILPEKLSIARKLIDAWLEEK